MKKILLLLSIVVMRQINAQTFVTIPDTNFVTYLQSIVPTAMSGSQLDISSTSVTTYTQSFVVYNKNIANLYGIQFFTSITWLDCGSNPLTTLPPLPNSLTHFSCDVDHLTNLPSLPNSLQFLSCTSNSLTTLPSLPNTLTYLACSWNSLITLPTLPNSITSLQCGDNNITCFPYIPNSLSLFSYKPNSFNCLPNYMHLMGSDTTVYPLCATGNSNGCPVANSIEQYQHAPEVTIYPNPTSDQFYIKTNATDKLTVDLYDINGRHVFSSSVNDKSNINVTALENGIYTMTIKSIDHTTIKKLVIVR